MFENLDAGRVLMAFGLTVFAGLSTGIGSLIALSSRAMNKKFLSMALGFSAGVMIYVSFVEILDKARISFVSVLGERAGAWATAGAFFGGVALIAIIDNNYLFACSAHKNNLPYLVQNKVYG